MRTFTDLSMCRMPGVRRLFAVFAVSLFAYVFVIDAHTAPSKSPDPITVLAASSLTQVLPEVAEAWKKQGGREIVFSFEASSRLAKQIEAGIPADIFFSADTAWMEFLSQKGKIDSATRTSLLSNRMVVVVPNDSIFHPTSSAELLVPQLKHFALAGESVPAGKFARAALKSGGVLEKLQDKIVNADSVRGALAWVAKKEAEAGIVFQTDARIEPRVKVAFTFGEGSHPKIEYPVAVIRGTQRLIESKNFIEFCKSSEAQKIFEAAGFTVLKR
jgi:molybdate transport system substrate-binding protein